MIKFFSLIIVLVFSSTVLGQIPNQLPRNLRKPPVVYLGELNLDRSLDEPERQILVRLVVEAYVMSARKNQDEILAAWSPFGKLLLDKFPGLRDRCFDGGINLGTATRYFYSFDEYKPIVEAALDDKTINKGNCTSQR